MTTDPITLFSTWYLEEISRSTSKVPNACCFSTNGLDGYPNARFVSLKDVKDETFVITGPISSRKGLEVEESNKVALTFWWPATERQVRIQGIAALIDSNESDKHFRDRNLESRIVALVSDQGGRLKDRKSLIEQYEETFQKYRNKHISRPAKWSGFAIHPIRIEFMQFLDNRLHDRTLFVLSGGEWVVNHLQP